MGSEIEDVLDEKTLKKMDLDDNICQQNGCFNDDGSKKLPLLPSNSFSKLLEGVVLAANSANALQGQVHMSHQEALGTVTNIAAQAHHQMKPQDDPDTQASEVSKTPKSDGYSWRKYGQKHVKNTGSSRSYFRCISASCCAKKKVQHFDGSGEIIEVVYKGDHNHDPPPCTIKGFARKKSFSNSLVEKVEDPCREEPKQVLQPTYECQDAHFDNSVGKMKKDVEAQNVKTPDTTRMETIVSTLPVEAEHRSRFNNSTELTDAMNERDIPIKKRRIKESGKESSQLVYRTFKEPKIIVQTAGDAGISSDGYRWRKYGQKMVKGKLHPRSYYRCSSAGCPVRKHVEGATDGSSAVVAMYEGEHDHDKPLPKKQQSSLKPSILVNAPPSHTVNNVPLLKSGEKSVSPGRGSSAQQYQTLSNDHGEQNGLPESGPEKVLESARTQLNIGIELESC